MVFPKARLAVSACLFLGWIGILLFLVLRTRDPVILSRPQFLESPLHVIADVRARNGLPDPEVTIVEVAWSSDAADKNLAGVKLLVEDLSYAGPDQGWSGAGQYLLPLTKRTIDKGFGYKVTPLPWHPGYVPQASVEVENVGPEPEKVAEIVQTLTGMKFEPGAVWRNVSWNDALQLKTRLEEAKASVRMRGETRIYRASPETLSQWRQLGK
ncbi:MAG: hypothetical protein L0Y72_24220 [Gemmataceae bacterium]|nr:hypothetical protein [Gemmataceae bacterium]MCI0742152.1 hypothetical protein [Gemmataceae bacterium]